MCFAPPCVLCGTLRLVADGPLPVHFVFAGTLQVHAVLLQLAKQGKLGAQVEAAKETMKRKVEEKKAKGQPIEVDDF